MRQWLVIWAMVLLLGSTAVWTIQNEVDDIRRQIEAIRYEENPMSASFVHNGTTYTVTVPRYHPNGEPRPRAEVVAELISDLEALKEAVGYVEPG